MLGKVGGRVVIEGLAHTELWVEYNLPYVNLLFTAYIILIIIIVKHLVVILLGIPFLTTSRMMQLLARCFTWLN